MDFKLTGADADNYTLTSQPASVTAHITARPLTITGVAATNRAYNGTTLVTLAGGVLENVVGGDNVGFTLGSGVMLSADTGSNKTVITNIVLTGADKDNYTLTQPAGITVNIGYAASVLSDDRTSPIPSSEEAVVIAPEKSSYPDEFTAGPNIVRRGDAVKIYRHGARFTNGALSVYDAAGNVITKLSISDNAPLSQPSHPSPARREVGIWDLRDAKGRPVAEGTYLLHGTVTVAGRRERVSLLVTVR